MSAFKKKFNKEVPEYMLDLVESGMSIEDAIHLDKHEVDMRIVKKVLNAEKSKSQQRQAYKSANHKRNPLEIMEEEMLKERKLRLKKSIRDLREMIEVTEAQDPQLKRKMLFNGSL